MDKGKNLFGSGLSRLGLSPKLAAQEPDAMLGPITVGEFETVDIKIKYQEEATWTQTIHYPEAAYIKVHFLELNVLAGDYVTVSNPESNEMYTYPDVSGYTTDEGKGFWAISVTGDTAIVKLHSKYDAGKMTLDDNELQQLGVVIDKYARGYPPEVIRGEGIEIESVCGTDQRTDVVCYASSHPTEYDNSSPVAMHLMDGVRLCTAWRVGPGNHMFTAAHCIDSQHFLNRSEFWFNYQRLLCESGGTGSVTKVTGDTLLIADSGIDFALFTVDNFSSISSFGYLDLDPRTPVLGEEIYIPQHGLGDPKQFGIESDMNAGNVCRIDYVTIDNPRTHVDTNTGYYCDTRPGSSGSPVLARSSHKAIALHTDPGCPNSGGRMELIWPLVAPYFCTPPPSGDWHVQVSCTMSQSATASANVIVENGATLTIPNDVSLNINFVSHRLEVTPGSRVIVEPGGRIE